MQIRKRADPRVRCQRRIYRRPRIEQLGPRIVFAVYVVTTTGDVVDESDGVVSLREAITQANAEADSDTIQFESDLFANGPASIELASGQIVIDNGLELIGPGPELLVIDARSLSRAFEVSSGTFDVKISGITITGGATFGDDEYLVNENDGPAILAKNSGATELFDIVVSQNQTRGSYAHGAVSAVGGSLVVRSALFEDNSTTGYRSFGGAIYVFNNNVRIESSIFRNNASLGPEGGGGAVTAEFGTIDVFDSTFTGNVVAGYAAFGGAISGGDTTITRSAIRGNRTEGTFGRGGGISVERLTLVDSQVSENETRGDGANGGGIWSGRDVTAFQSVVSRNSTVSLNSRGGGIAFDGYISSGSLVLDETLLTDNTSSRNSEVWFSSNNIADFDIDVRLTGKQLLSFGDADRWRMGQPLDRNGTFLLTASHVDSVMSQLVIETSHPFTNPLSLSDVNNNGSVTPLDALVIINEIARQNRNLGRGLTLGAPTLEDWRGLYFDQNQDGRVTALDALRVINEISRANRSASGESIAFSRVLSSNTFQHQGPKNLNPDDDVKASVPSNGLAPSHKLKTTDLIIENYGQRATENVESEPASLSQQAPILVELDLLD